MAYTGTINSEEAAVLASQTILLAQQLGYLVDANLTSLAAAKAAIDAKALTVPTRENIYADQFKRALDLAVAYGGASVVTGSSLATLYAALPDNGGNTARLRM